MGVFNVSFLKGGTGGGGSSYSDAVTVVEVLESTLKGDGVLSAGDYDQLISAAEKFASVGTASQRNEWKKRIAGYQSLKSQFGVGRLNDLEELNKGYQSDIYAATMAYGNDLPSYMRYREMSLNNKLSQLATSVEQLSASGGNYYAQMNAYNETLSELADLEAVKEQVNTGQPGNFVAYIETNDKGEIRVLDYGRPGRAGYTETNGIYGGLQVYGKPNTVKDGQKVFEFGGDTYRGTDADILDPRTGTSRSAPLLSSETKMDNPYMIVTPDIHKTVDPASVGVQSYIPTGKYAKGVSGTMYETLPQGGYRKYVDFDMNQLGLSERDINFVPQEIEAGINMGVRDTLSGFDYPQLSMERGVVSVMPRQSFSVEPEVGVEQPVAGVKRTTSPKERSPMAAQAVAGRTVKAARGFYAGR